MYRNRAESAVTDPKNILICDDESTLRELVRLTLGPEFHITEACDGDEALVLARELRPDVVVLDLMLPRKTGSEVLAEIRRDCRIAGTRVLVVTAWAHVEDEMLSAGADGFMRKPFDPDALRTEVGKLAAAA